jgi:hypothetical protein
VTLPADWHARCEDQLGTTTNHPVPELVTDMPDFTQATETHELDRMADDGCPNAGDTPRPD